ncbi:MAG: electron transfer flavoprotein subunit beta [Deltaproteobacteria bacterium]|nr:electron transfer flavoprotein subunit beta [Deltaproteobacteria bacterium]
MAAKPLDIAVLLREVRDPRPPVRLEEQGVAVRDTGIRRIPNPADLSALEVALRLAEAMRGSVTVLAVGPKRLEDALCLAASLGADRTLRVWDDGMSGGDAVADARVLRRVLEILRPSLFFTGSRVLDRGDDPSAALAACALGIPFTNAALSLAIDSDGVQVLRKAERGGRQKVSLRLPCAVFFDAAAAEPHYPDLEAVLGSLEAPVERWGMPELGLPAVELGFAGAVLRPAGVAFPRPDPLRVLTPDPTLPGHERVAVLLSGGIRAREGRIHFSTPDEAVARLLDIFAEEGLLDVAEEAKR